MHSNLDYKYKRLWWAGASNPDIWFSGFAFLLRYNLLLAFQYSYIIICHDSTYYNNNKNLKSQDSDD